MNRKTVVLGLFNDRIDLLLRHGEQVVGSRQVAVRLSADAEGWSKSLKEASRPLQQAVQSLGITRCHTTVIYRNSTACVDLASVGIAANAAARQAAILGSTDSLSCPMDAAAFATAVIGRDAAGHPPQTHVIVAADHDQVLSAISELVQSAGLVFDAAIPLDALLLSQLAERSLKSDKPNMGTLYVGEHHSFFIVVDRGSLLFARTISLGSESLVSSLTKPLRVAGQSGATLELNLNDARAMLKQHGFPARDQVVHESPTLTGAQIIPLLQPVLQRFIVELRQSLRFGIPSGRVEGEGSVPSESTDTRGTIELVVCGPGSVIPNFASIVAAELGLGVSIQSDAQASSDIGGDLTNALHNRKRFGQLHLRPRTVAHTHTINRLKRLMWTGAAAALALMGIDYAGVHSRLTDLRAQAHAIRTQSTDLKALRATTDKINNVVGAMGRLESLIEREAGGAINLRACLQELSRIAPESIRLAGISINYEKSRAMCKFSGQAFEALADASGSNRASSRAQLELFVEKLKSSPLFEEVLLTNVTSSAGGERSGHRFEIGCAGVSIPRSIALQIADRDQTPAGDPPKTAASAATGGHQ